MCGIVGFTGKRKAVPILLEGLSKLEYRGYDSAGIAVLDVDKVIKIIKTKGRVAALSEKIQTQTPLTGHSGIGHTRWATHGEPSETNAHPHYTLNKEVTIVHNGIIENYAEIKQELIKFSYEFYSQTDTEVAAKLIEYYLKKYKNNPVEALVAFMNRVRGSYAIAALFKDYPEEIYAVRKESPMLIGIANGETYLASDISALLKYTKNVYYMENMEIARLKKGEAEFYNRNGDRIDKKITQITWNTEVSEKGGYPHFMLKEIFEQPKAVKNTIGSTFSEEIIDLSKIGLTEAEIKKIEQICIVACGSAYHAGVVAQYVIEKWAKCTVRVELASEFRYRDLPLNKNTLVIIISQSGETADSLAALREAKSWGIKTLAIVNVVGSSIAREADYVFYTQAGPEIAVATTKAYSTQLIAGYALALEFARMRGKIKKQEYDKFLLELQVLPDKIKQILGDTRQIEKFAQKIVDSKSIFFMGRGVDYALSLEGSLKLKEISYIHSEAYAAGELKHGTISLIEKGVPVVSILTQKKLFEKTLGNMTEVKSRGAYVVAVTYERNKLVEEVADFTLYIPETEDAFAASLAVIPLQLLSYYVSVFKGLDVDKPRNLAKSVTVE